MVRRRRISHDYDTPGLFDDILRIEEPPTPRHKPAVDDDEPAIAPLEVTAPTGRLKFISFGSGSSGNCSYLGNDEHGILIDAGVDADTVTNELRRNGIDMQSVGGIILTHDHGDHVRFAYPLLRRNRHMRLYCTNRVLNGILRRHSVSRRIADYHQPIFKEIFFHIYDFKITPFEVYHDGSDNVGFFIENSGLTFVVATDMGDISDRADFYIRQANHLMIEANYDLTMLLSGSYPEYLKARIMGKNGHMDNELTARYLARVHTPALRNIFLCHLSHDNNTPDIAVTCITHALRDKGLDVGDASGSITARRADVQLMALPRFDSTGLIILR